MSRCTLRELIQTANDFDKLLAQVTEETIKYCFGDMNATIIWNYLEQQNCLRSEIPNKPECAGGESYGANKNANPDCR
jgi:hypothetical protein